MLSTKEKALELREKCDGYTCYAEVVVDEILNALSYKISSNFEELKYYEEVKQELNKL